MTEYQDRIKEVRTVPAKSIRMHPDNPRLHTGEQKNALKYLLSKVGIASVPICYDDPLHGLTLIDGHLRQETIDQDIKVVVLDVTPEQASLLLLTMDQVGGMAKLDDNKVSELFGATYDPAGEHLKLMQTLFGSVHPSKEQKVAEPVAAELPDAEPAEERPTRFRSTLTTNTPGRAVSCDEAWITSASRPPSWSTGSSRWMTRTLNAPMKFGAPWSPGT